MPSVLSELEATVRLAIAALVGLGVGLEREWSGHAAGPNARFAGLRTFLLLGVLGGIGGVLLALGHEIAGASTIVGGMALAIAAYATTVRRANTEIDGTTEAAAAVVVALGAIAGVGWLALAAGAGSLIVLALSEKERLHWLVGRLNESELRAALQFAVLALVVLPLLPAGPIGGAIALQPRALWIIVLFFCALNFAGFLARRAIGPAAGYTLTGLLGGLVSSTAVTLDFARKSRREPSFQASLAYGVIGACTVLIPRVLIVSGVLNAEVASRLFWMLALPLLCGLVVLWFALRRKREPTGEVTPPSDSPLRLRAAIQMTVAFQIALMAIRFANARWGQVGVYPTAAALGLTDMDALTVSMSRADAGITADIAAKAVAVGIIANTAMKLSIAAVLGGGVFRRVVALGLLMLAATTVVGLMIFARLT